MPKPCEYCNGLGCSACDHTGIHRGCRCADCSGAGLTLTTGVGRPTGHLCKKCNGYGFWARKEIEDAI